MRRIVAVVVLVVSPALLACEGEAGACYGGNYSLFAQCDCDAYGCSIPGPPYYECAFVDCRSGGLFCANNFGVVAECVPYNYTPDGSECGCNGFQCWFT
jgi:hypothetical protein